jgi:hypothetical protein
VYSMGKCECEEARYSKSYQISMGHHHGSEAFRRNLLLSTSTTYINDVVDVRGTIHTRRTFGPTSPPYKLEFRSPCSNSSSFSVASRNLNGRLQQLRFPSCISCFELWLLIMAESPQDNIVQPTFLTSPTPHSTTTVHSPLAIEMSRAISDCSLEHDSVPTSDEQRATANSLNNPSSAATTSPDRPVDHGFRSWQYDHQYGALDRELRLCTAETDALLAYRPLSASNRSKDIVLRERIRELLHEQDVLNEVYEK